MFVGIVIERLGNAGRFLIIDKRLEIIVQNLPAKHPGNIWKLGVTGKLVLLFDL